MNTEQGYNFDEKTPKEASVKHFLVLHNDNHNTFDFVMESLVEICDHDALQAEQCTFIAHHKGKCDIKKGSFEYLQSFKKKLMDKGLTVTIE